MRGARHVEGADEIDIDHHLEAVGRKAEGRRREIAGRPRDQHIDLPEAVMGGTERPLDRLVIADIGHLTQDLAPMAADRTHRRLDPLRVATRHGESCTT